MLSKCRRKMKKHRSKKQVHRFNLPCCGHLERLQATAALFIVQKRC